LFPGVLVIAAPVASTVRDRIAEISVIEDVAGGRKTDDAL
jgi:hypothetical protein